MSETRNRDEAIQYVADLGYGMDNAKDWVLSAAFAGLWCHPAQVLSISWDAVTDRYTIKEGMIFP